MTAQLTRKEAIELLGSRGSRLEVSTERIDGVSYRVPNGHIKTLVDLYAENGDNDETVLMVYKDDRYTMKEVFLKSANLAWRLQTDFDVQKGDRIAIAARNYPEWCFAFMAITSLNCIAVALNAWWSAEELVYGLKDSGSRLLFADSERIERLGPLIQELDLPVIAIRAEGLDVNTSLHIGPLLEGDRTAAPPVDIDPNDSALLMYTSGSTGKPKGVLSSHRAVLTPLVAWIYLVLVDLFMLLPEAALEPWKAWLFKQTEVIPPLDPTAVPEDPPPQPGMLSTFPLFHVSGLIVQFLNSILSKRKLVFMRKWNPEKALELIERERLTGFDGVPTQSWDLINSVDFEKRDTRTLLLMNAGGAKRPVEQAKQIERKFSASIGSAGYGLTETNGLATSIRGEDYVKRPASVGRPLAPLVEMEIRDFRGTVLPPGREGEICIKSCSLFKGYWNRPDATRDVLKDGWFRTGDLGYLDGENFLFITDRAKDIVIRGGENIGCAEVEEVLYEHPAVYEATVFGLPDERLGEILAAAIMVAPGHEITETELKGYVESRLAKFKVPAVIWFHENPLPRIASGKIDKVQIKRAAAAWYQKES
ncbi:MAG: class I adenylate-forming enzyme family protein [bacterium]